MACQGGTILSVTIKLGSTRSHVWVLIWLVSALPSASQTSGHLSNVRQLTFGGQNAEAYWSPDGQRLIFQSTRDGNRCDQIYVMNVDGSGIERVSTGKGVTTCGYFFPDGKRIIYASTHEGQAGCPPRPDRSKGYVWPVHETYELYVADDDGNNLQRLTETLGYDAEATVNWKTGKVIYTSKASGDLDLWSMDLDGSNNRRLTKTLGYDGGAFFSPTGDKIVWRAHHPTDAPLIKHYRELLAQNLTTPMKMELFVANSDGSDALQITNFGCASFAPQFAPDGKRIIFSSNENRCDSREFELFLIDVDGDNLEQVTDFGGFTSFAEFSPDGTKLVFTSSHNAKSRYEFNIFVADWDR